MTSHASTSAPLRALALALSAGALMSALFASPAHAMSGWSSLTGPSSTLAADSPQGRQVLDRIDAAALRTGKKAKDGWVSRSTITDTQRAGTPPTSEDSPWLVVNTRVAVHRPFSVVGAAEVTRRVIADGQVQDAYPYINAKWGASNSRRGPTTWALPPLTTPLEKEAWAAARSKNPGIEGVSFTPVRAGGWELSDRPNTPEGISHWAESNGLTPWGIVTSAALRDDLKATRIVDSGDSVIVHYVGTDSYTHSGSLSVTFDKGFVARAVFTVTFPDAFSPGVYAMASQDATLLQVGYTTITPMSTIPEREWADIALIEAAQHARSTVRDLLAASDAAPRSLPSLVRIPMAGAAARIASLEDGSSVVRVSFRGESVVVGCAMTLKQGVISRCAPETPEEQDSSIL